MTTNLLVPIQCKRFFFLSERTTDLMLYQNGLKEEQCIVEAINEAGYGHISMMNTKGENFAKS